MLVAARSIGTCTKAWTECGAHCTALLLLLLTPAAGHAGYELSPFIPTLAGIWALLSCGLRGSRGINTVQHHDMHHR
jgi:hypothetical protein